MSLKTTGTPRKRAGCRAGKAELEVHRASLSCSDEAKVSDGQGTSSIWRTERDIQRMVDGIMRRMADLDTTSAEDEQEPDLPSPDRQTGLCPTGRAGQLFAWADDAEIHSEMILRTIATRAYRGLFNMIPEDHVIANSEVNAEFIRRCRLLGATASEYRLNLALLNARKAGMNSGLTRRAVRGVHSATRNHIVFAAELAAKAVQIRTRREYGFIPSIDRILCDQGLREYFDYLAASVFPGSTTYAYRLASLSLRKAGRARSTAALTRELPPSICAATLSQIDPDDVPARAGVYFVRSGIKRIFASFAPNLRERTLTHLRFGGESLLPPEAGETISGRLSIDLHPVPHEWTIGAAEALALRLRPQSDPCLNVLATG